jgi:pimeloyl-ACP methyl ester carboxylesterase
MQANKITLTTKDSVDLSAFFWDAGTDKTVLCLHMMPETKEGWMALAERLASAGSNVLALDFRGHGDSGGGDYKTFSDEDHQKYFLDALAAIKFLQSKFGVVPDVALVGASIGANVALKLAFEYEWIEKAVLLSPGLNYHGVDIGTDIRLQSPEFYAAEILFVASKDDGENLLEVSKLHELYGGKILVYDGGGHGSDIIKNNPELLDIIPQHLNS